MFYDGRRHTNLGKRAHVLKNKKGRIIIGPFERCFYEGSLWRGHRAVILFILTFFCISFVTGIDLMTVYIKS